ncbi:LOW QUALITY PROTEIN: hypothetical protein ACHAWF_001916, partial [Thalassiosira exigua]
KAYFFNTIIGEGTLGDDSRPTRLVGRNVGFSFLAWTVVYFCVAFGIKWTGRITYFTMGFPSILLFIFLGRAVALEGAQDGIQEYIHDANWEVLKTSVWAKATSQIFFSLSITFGAMTAYGSHCKRNEPAFVNSCVVAISNCLFSFIAGFSVYATLGYLAHLEDLENVSSLEYVSFGLVFGSWPMALGTLPGGEHWIRLFFVMLFLLGIDTAFAFLEGFLTVLHDTELLKNVPRKVLCLVMSVCLDTIDYYINFVMLLVGGFECFAAGWVYKIELDYMFTTSGSVVLACALWFGMKNTDTALWAGFVGLVISYSLGMAFVAFLMSNKKQSNPDLTWKAMCYDLFMGNVMSDLREVVGYIPVAWAFLVKHLFSLDVDTNLVNSEGELVYGENGKPLKKMGNYERYPEQPYQVVGVLIVAFARFLIVSSLVFPRMYNALRTPGETSAENDKA